MRTRLQGETEILQSMLRMRRVRSVRLAIPSIIRNVRRLRREQAGLVYMNGDLGRYTGNTLAKHGGLFYEVEMLEGHLKGQARFTQRAPVAAS